MRFAKGLLRLAFCCAAFWLVMPGNAQDEDQNVHIAPREAKKPDPVPSAGIAVPPGVIVDPSLKTHTKPIRKDVDLVLVPVTITDPMNRLAGTT